MNSEKKKSKEEGKKENIKYVLKGTHISEKATDLAQRGFYAFKVEKNGNKREIKEEIEKKYKVNVEKVRIINVPSKKRRTGRIEGIKRGYKKAVAKLKEGDSIDLGL